MIVYDFNVTKEISEKVARGSLVRCSSSSNVLPRGLTYRGTVRI